MLCITCRQAACNVCLRCGVAFCEEHYRTEVFTVHISVGECVELMGAANPAHTLAVLRDMSDAEAMRSISRARLHNKVGADAESESEYIGSSSEKAGSSSAPPQTDAAPYSHIDRAMELVRIDEEHKKRNVKLTPQLMTELGRIVLYPAREEDVETEHRADVIARTFVQQIAKSPGKKVATAPDVGMTVDIDTSLSYYFTQFDNMKAPKGDIGQLFKLALEKNAPVIVCCGSVAPGTFPVDTKTVCWYKTTHNDRIIGARRIDASPNTQAGELNIPRVTAHVTAAIYAIRTKPGDASGSEPKQAETGTTTAAAASVDGKEQLEGYIVCYTIPAWPENGLPLVSLDVADTIASLEGISSSIEKTFGKLLNPDPQNSIASGMQRLIIASDSSAGSSLMFAAAAVIHLLITNISGSTDIAAPMETILKKLCTGTSPHTMLSPIQFRFLCGLASAWMTLVPQ